MRKIWKVAWRLAVCLLLLAWIFQAIFYNEGRLEWSELNPGKDWHALTRKERFDIAWLYGPTRLWETFKLMKAWALALSVVLMGMTIFLGVVRWQMVLRVHGLQMPLWRITQISLVAHFFNSFLLGSVGGDLLKAYYVARETHHKKTEAVITVFVDRILGLFSMLVFACVMMIPNLDLLTYNYRLRMLVWLILAMTAGCAMFLVVSFWGGVSKSVPGARKWLRKLPKGEMIERSLEAFREFGKDKTFLFRMLPIWTICNIVLVLHFLSLTWGFGLDLSPLALSAIVPMVTSISALPITPSGLGVRENLYVWMLAAPGIDTPAAQALLLSLVGYAGSLLWSLIGGVVYLTLRDREHLKEIAAEGPPTSFN
ncbi:MAG: lysylphosphatidylglycerol synthase transmembrane domain-containing protein [Verrucomicrobiota bacterium]|nr:lysylphosphatidylglycerol synthase transmembrane domain-containing protein [Verrucomicrobiota bacterium]